MTAIDISAWQGHPDFAQVKAAGVSLVIMKCGGGEGGRLYGDSVYVANRTAARAQGLAVGSYFFNGPVDPTTAADYQWSIIDWRPGDIVAIDVENSTGVTRWTPAQVLAWVNRILEHGVPASQILVYMSSSVTQLRVTPKALPGSAWLNVVATGVGLWVAQYGSNNGGPQGSPSIAGWTSWALWQYTSAKTWPGIVGNVDTNQIAGSWAGSIGSPITNTPTQLPQEEVPEMQGIKWVVNAGQTSGQFVAGTFWWQDAPGLPVRHLDDAERSAIDNNWSASTSLGYAAHPEIGKVYPTMNINGADLARVAAAATVPVAGGTTTITGGVTAADIANLIAAIDASKVTHGTITFP